MEIINIAPVKKATLITDKGTALMPNGRKKITNAPKMPTQKV